MNQKKKQFLPTKELQSFFDIQPLNIKQQFFKIIEKLENKGYLVPPYAKKLTDYENLFEIRILSGSNVRVFYCYIGEKYIIGLSGFVKKSQETPPHEIKKAIKIKKAIGGII